MYLIRLFSFIVAARCWFSHRSLLMVFIKEVPLEHGLRRWVLQMDLILFNGIGILPFLVVDMILIKIVALLTWKIRCNQVTGLKCTPVEIFEPWVGFHFWVSVETQATRCFSLKTLILKNKLNIQRYVAKYCENMNYLPCLWNQRLQHPSLLAPHFFWCALAWPRLHLLFLFYFCLDMVGGRTCIPRRWRPLQSNLQRCHGCFCT